MQLQIEIFLNFIFQVVHCKCIKIQFIVYIHLVFWNLAELICLSSFLVDSLGLSIYKIDLFENEVGHT